MTTSGAPFLPSGRSSILPTFSPAVPRASTATAILVATALAVPLGTNAAWAQGVDDDILGISPGDIDITLSASGQTTLTDRAGGAGNDDDDDDGDIITTVTSTVSAVAQGARTNLAGTYSIGYDHYLSDSDRSGYDQTLLAAGTYSAVEDRLFFDANASLATRYTGVGATSATDRVGVGDQTQTFTWSFGPTWRQRVGGSFADLQASYRISGTSFFEAGSGDVGDDERPGDGIIHNFSTGLSSGQDFNRLRWSLSGSWQVQTGDDDDNDTSRRSVEASTEYRINRQFGLLGRVGYDDVDLADESEGVTSESDLSGLFWAAGLRFNPSPRTDMSAEYGRRYGGPFYSGSVNWRITPRTSVSAIYDTAVTTLQESVLVGVSPECLSSALGSGAVEIGCLLDLINTGALTPEGLDPDAPYSLVDATTRTENFRIAATHRLKRTRFSVAGTVTQREYTQSGADETTVGVSFGASHDLTPQTTGSLALSYTTSDNTVSGSEDTGLTTSDGSSSLRGRLSLSHQFADDLTGSLSYSHLRRDDDSDSGTSSENALVARVAVTF